MPVNSHTRASARTQEAQKDVAGAVEVVVAVVSVVIVVCVAVAVAHARANAMLLSLTGTLVETEVYGLWSFTEWSASYKVFRVSAIALYAASPARLDA